MDIVVIFIHDDNVISSFFSDWTIHLVPIFMAINIFIEIEMDIFICILGVSTKGSDKLPLLIFKPDISRTLRV
jgi:hypothetical protein